MGAEIGRCLLPGILLFVLSCPAVFVASGGAAGSCARVIWGQWTLTSPMGEAAGHLVSLIEHNRSWRLDFSLDEGSVGRHAEDLIHRRGSGWTMAAVETDVGFGQAWHRPWRRLGPSTSAAMHELVLQLTDGPARTADQDQDAKRARRWRRPAAESVGRVVFNALGELSIAWDDLEQDAAQMRHRPGSLRRALVARGIGRGGAGLCLSFRWVGPSLVLSSARWPGRLSIMTTERQIVKVPSEAFLPLWPLAEFLP